MGRGEAACRGRGAVVGWKEQQKASTGTVNQVLKRQRCVFMSVFAWSWSNGSFFRQSMLMWFSYSLCIGTIITNFMTALGQMSVRTHSFPTLHLRLFPSFLMPPSHCPHYPLQTELSFVVSRPFFPYHCHPFFHIILQAEKANPIYKQLYVTSQSLFLIGSLKAKAENFQQISFIYWVLIFVNVCIAILWLL